MALFTLRDVQIPPTEIIYETEICIFIVYSDSPSWPIVHFKAYLLSFLLQSKKCIPFQKEVAHVFRQALDISSPVRVLLIFLPSCSQHTSKLIIFFCFSKWVPSNLLPYCEHSFPWAKIAFGSLGCWRAGHTIDISLLQYSRTLSIKVLSMRNSMPVRTWENSGLIRVFRWAFNCTWW